MPEPIIRLHWNCRNIEARAPIRAGAHREKAIIKYSILAAIMSVATTSAVAQERAGFFALRAVGDTNWTMTCDVRLPNGETTTQTVRGERREQAYFTHRRATGATCSYEVQQGQPLRLEFEDRAFACPFTASEDGLCRTSIAGGQSGRFEVRLRD